MQIHTDAFPGEYLEVLQHLHRNYGAGDIMRVWYDGASGTGFAICRRQYGWDANRFQVTLEWVSSTKDGTQVYRHFIRYKGRKRNLPMIAKKGEDN